MSTHYGHACLRRKQVKEIQNSIVLYVNSAQNIHIQTCIFFCENITCIVLCKKYVIIYIK